MLLEADIPRVHMTRGTYFAEGMVAISGQCYTLFSFYFSEFANFSKIS